MKIVIFSNIPSPYFVEYLNELGKLAEVFAVFERKKADDRDTSWTIVNAKNFKYSFLRGLKVGVEASLSFEIKKYIKKNEDSIIIFANPTTPTGIIGIHYCKRKKIEYCLQSEGGMYKNTNGFKERFKRKLFSGAKLYLTGMKPETDYFHHYGASLDRIRQYPFASLSNKDLIVNPLTHEEKKRIRKSINVNCDKMVLYVGRMLYCKGVDILLKAFSEVDSNVSLYCVGGSANDEYLQIINKNNNKSIYFVEHVGLEELKKYYMSADLFVLPTRGDTWGLVINEAMSFGLPVITTNKCVAGNELIEDDVNGYIVNSESVSELEKCIKKLIHDTNIDRFSSANISKISSYTYEKMAHIIYRHICDYFKK